MSDIIIKQDKNGRTYIHLPAYLRDKFDIRKGETVDVDTDGTNIIIRFKK